MRLRIRYRAGIGLILLVFLAGADADGSVPGWNRFVYLAYRLEVTGYCGLTTERALEGYQARRSGLIEIYQLDSKSIDSARGEAWKLAYKEWDNRGLGGFRRWCSNEGRHYLEFLESIPLSVESD